MHKKQSKELKKTQTSIQFNQILTNAKISVLNFSEKPPAFLKEILNKDVLVFPIARTTNQSLPESITAEQYLAEVGRLRELQREANFRVNKSKSPVSPKSDRMLLQRKKSRSTSAE